MQLQRTREAGAHVDELGGKAKIALVPIDRFGIGLALTAGLSYGLRDDRINGGFVALPVTVTPTDDTRLSLNLGWRHDPVAQRDYAIWGGAAEWAVTSCLALLGEVFGESEGRPRWQGWPPAHGVRRRRRSRLDRRPQPFRPARRVAHPGCDSAVLRRRIRPGGKQIRGGRQTLLLMAAKARCPSLRRETCG